MRAQRSVVNIGVLVHFCSLAYVSDGDQLEGFLKVVLEGRFAVAGLVCGTGCSFLWHTFIE